MDPACLGHRLTPGERGEFDERGCFVVRNALPPDLVARLEDEADRLDAENRPAGDTRPINHIDCIGYDDAFLELLEWPKTIASYSYRWLRPRDDMTVDRYLADADPIRRQLLGASPTGGFGYTSPSEEDIPLRSWLVEHLGEKSVVP